MASNPSKIEIINDQRAIVLDIDELQTFAEDALSKISDGSGANIVFVSDEKIRELNRQFRGKDYATDVLSFPDEEGFEKDPDLLGEIIISAEQAARQAKENGLSFTNEIKQLILHGFLHLKGYDHETDNGEMNELELELREKLNI